MSENEDPEAYSFLYDRAIDGLRRQEAALDELRSRTGTLLAAASLVASLLGAAALSDGLGLSGLLAVGAFVLGAAFSIGILLPVRGWIFEPSIGKLFSDFIERDPPLPMRDIHRELAIHHAGHIDQNEERLKWLYRAFRASALLLAAQVVLFLFDIPRGGAIP